jgi:integrase
VPKQAKNGRSLLKVADGPLSRNLRTVLYFNKLRRINECDLSKKSVLTAKTGFMAQLYAQRQGVLDSPNPMREVEIPRARPAGETHAYTLEEEVRMLAILPEPAATIVAVAAFTGARKGEIRGFLWEGYDGYTIEVKQSVWRNRVGEPKREKSKGTIPVVAQLKLFLDRHRASSGNPSRGFIFRNLWGNPLNLDVLVRK